MQCAGAVLVDWNDEMSEQEDKNQKPEELQELPQIHLQFVAGGRHEISCLLVGIGIEAEKAPVRNGATCSLFDRVPSFFVVLGENHFFHAIIEPT